MGHSELVEAVLRAWSDQVYADGGRHAVGREAESAAEVAEFERQLVAFEQRHDLRLPAAFRALYRRSDGTGLMDANEIIFWPFDNIAIQLDINAQPEADPVWLQFADFRLGVRQFMLRFDRAGPGDQPVPVYVYAPYPPGPFLDGTSPLADSFEDFLQLYLTEPDRVVGRATDGRSVLVRLPASRPGGHS
jgi:hypothetical protein